VTRPWPTLIWPALLAGGLVTVVAGHRFAPDLWALDVAGALGLLAFVFGAGFFPQWQLFGAAVSRSPRSDAVALTFDDGPDPETTPRVLDLLEAAGARGTFFVVGRRVAEHGGVAREIVRRGHQVAFHGHAHRWSLMLSPRRFADDFEQGMRVVQEASGVSPRFYRPPVGLIAPPVYATLRRWGVRVAAWAVRPFDGGGLEAPRVVSRVLSKVRGGDIVLLHDATLGAPREPPVLAALPTILDGLAQRGLQAVTVADLTGEPAYLEDPMAVDRTRPRRSALEWATVLIVGMLLLGAAGSASAAGKNPLPEGLQAACAELASHATVKARFEQRKTSALFAKEVVRTGDLQLRRSDGRLIWAYDGGPKVLMADGRFYPADKSQEEIGAGASGWALPGAEKSGRIMESLFALDADTLQAFFEAEATGEGTWTLAPRVPAARAMFVKVELTIDGTPTALRRIAMDEASGDRTVIVFSALTLGATLDPDAFLTPAERSAAP